MSGKDTFPMCGEFSQNLVRECLGMEVPKHMSIDENVPARPPVMCAGCPHRGIFYILKKKIENKKNAKIFVPVSNVKYSNKFRMLYSWRSCTT